MAGRDASWRERPKRRRVSSASRPETSAAAHPSGAAYSLLDGCSTAQCAHPAPAVAAGGTALRKRGLELPRLSVSDLHCAQDCDWDQFLARDDPGVHGAAMDGWFARVRSAVCRWGLGSLHFSALQATLTRVLCQCFSCGQRTARSVHAVGFCLMTCARCVPRRVGPAHRPAGRDLR